MFRPLAVNIGLRYARSRRSFIAFISAVAIAGLVLSVAVLLLVTSVINGFERELRQRVLGVVPHLTVHGRPALADWQPLARDISALRGVTGVSPFIEGAGLAAAGNKSLGVTITGIVPHRQRRATALEQYLDGATLDDLQANAFRVLIGAKIAERLDVGVGDRITLVMPDASVTLAGVMPRQKRVTVAGLVRTQSDLDSRSVYMHLEDAARLFRLQRSADGGHVHGLQVRLEDLFAASAVGDAVLGLMADEPYIVSTWMRRHGNLYRAIGFQRSTMFLLLSLLVAVAAFNLVSSLIMVVNQRQGDIAILRTLGGNSRTIVTAFVVLGGLVGLLGVTAGLALGVGGSLFIEDGYRWLESRFQLDLLNQYFINYLPAEVRLHDVVLVAAVALGLCVLSTLYPALRAAALKPADVLRHE